MNQCLLQQDNFNFNSGLLLIRSLSARRTEDKPRSRPIRELAAILKLKHKQADNKLPEQAQMGMDWLKSQGISLQSLKDQVKQLKQQKVKSDSSKKQQNYFHVDLRKQPITQYLNKAEQYSSLNLMQFIMSRNDKRKINTFKLMEQILEDRPTYNSQATSYKEDREAYISITKQVAEVETQAMAISRAMLTLFRNKLTNLQHKSWWEILAQQLGTYDSSNTKESNLTNMLISSLKLIHKQFERRIDGKDIQSYINTEYLTKVESRQLEKVDGGWLWSKVWVAYCAGNTKKVQSLISSDRRDQRDLIRLYELTNQEILSGRPRKHTYTFRHDIDDIFYTQFIYNIIGKSLCSSKTLAEPLSLQFVLILVRTLGVFYQTQADEKKFKELRAMTVSNYKQVGPDPQMVKNMIYLVDYNSICQLGPNELMSSQDYLHFMIILAGFPELITLQNFKTTFTKLLVDFIIELFKQGRSEYIYYIKLLPDDVQAEQTSNIVMMVDGFDSFEWKALKGLIEKEQFEKIVDATIQAYRGKDGTELKAARKYVQLCQDYKKAFHCLTSYIVNYHLSRRKQNKDNITQAEMQGLRWCSQPSVPHAQAYKFLFEFLNDFHQYAIIAEQNYTLYERQHEMMLSFAMMITHQFHRKRFGQMFKLLNQQQGMELYYYFLRLLVRVEKRRSDKTDDTDRLVQLKATLAQHLEMIKRMEFLEPEVENIQLMALRDDLVFYVLDQI